VETAEAPIGTSAPAPTRCACVTWASRQSAVKTCAEKRVSSSAAIAWATSACMA
jgi:hypothetical protein